VSVRDVCYRSKRDEDDDSHELKVLGTVAGADVDVERARARAAPPPQSLWRTIVSEWLL
jgi:hypothetical protein